MTTRDMDGAIKDLGQPSLARLLGWKGDTSRGPCTLCSAAGVSVPGLGQSLPALEAKASLYRGSQLSQTVSNTHTHTRTNAHMHKCTHALTHAHTGMRTHANTQTH
jgi:hypothetical protein